MNSVLGNMSVGITAMLRMAKSVFPSGICMLLPLPCRDGSIHLPISKTCIERLPCTNYRVRHKHDRPDSCLLNVYILGIII